MKQVVLEAGGMLRGSSGPALQTFLRGQPGIHHAEANDLNQTVTVGYDQDGITHRKIEQLIERCGYHCRGEVVPAHLHASAPEVAAGASAVSAGAGARRARRGRGRSAGGWRAGTQEQWTEQIAEDIARENGIAPLTERHWQVIRFMRNRYLETGSAPSIRTLGKESGVLVKELYQLLPKGPAKLAAKIRTRLERHPTWTLAAQSEL